MNHEDASRKFSEQLLRDAYRQPEPLPGDFERQVMHRLEARPAGWLHSHRVFLLMGVYWVIAASLAGWSLGGLNMPESSTGPWVAVLSTFVLCVLAIGMIARQARIRLGAMLLKTVQ